MKDATDYAQRNKEAVKERLKAWHRENKKPRVMGPFMPKSVLAERKKQKRKLMTEEQRQKDREAKKRWADKNKHVAMEVVRRRQARKKQATPKWADRKAMQAVYRAAVVLTDKTGAAHDVDHIVPLTSDSVCGLHCEFNLRVIPRTENRKKANAFDESLLWF